MTRGSQLAQSNCSHSQLRLLIISAIKNACTPINVCLMGVHFIGVHSMGVNVIGVHLTGLCLMDVYLMGVHASLIADTLFARFRFLLTNSA